MFGTMRPSLRILLLLPLVGCPEPPPPCTEHVDCAADAFCADETFCLSVFEREYEVTMISATVPSTGPTGGPWDIDDSSDPDLVAFFGVPEERDAAGEVLFPGSAGSTTVQDDTLEANWSESAQITLSSGRGFAIEVYDADGQDAAFIGGWFWETDEQVVDLVRNLGEEQLVESGAFSTAFQFDPPDR